MKSYYIICFIKNRVVFDILYTLNGELSTYRQFCFKERIVADDNMFLRVGINY